LSNKKRKKKKKKKKISNVFFIWRGEIQRPVVDLIGSVLRGERNCDNGIHSYYVVYYSF